VRDDTSRLRIFNDRECCFGFGHYVKLMFHYDDLPKHAQDILSDNLLNLFIIYAHLSDFNVKESDELSAGVPFAITGNTGNSTGPHLHLETRIAHITDIVKGRWTQQRIVNPLEIGLWDVRT